MRSVFLFEQHYGIPVPHIFFGFDTQPPVRLLVYEPCSRGRVKIEEVSHGNATAVSRYFGRDHWRLYDIGMEAGK